MYRGYQVVICIAAGRWRHMEILLRQLNKYRSVVDKIHLWINCVDPEDRRRLRVTAALDSYYTLVELEDKSKINPAVLWESVCLFYKYACEVNTIYIKVDDDIVWVDDLEHFCYFLDFRIDNRQYFLTSANVMINAICNHLHQQQGCVQGFEHITYDAHDQNIFLDGSFVERLHEFVLSQGGPDARRWDLSTKHEVQDYARICINFISWFGDDFANFGGQVPKEDETWLTVDKPKDLSRCVAVCPNYGCVHYSFGPTRRFLDSKDLLLKYRNLIDA